MKKLRLRWSLRARQDLARIKAFIEFDKPVAARNFVGKIKKSVERLALFPRSARVVAEIGREDIREIIVGGYRVIYRIDSGMIRIVTVFDGHLQFRYPVH